MTAAAEQRLNRQDVEGLAVAVAGLAHALDIWAGRDDTRPQPDVRRAGNAAMDAIDRALAELHRIRQSLVGELHASDEADGRRIDALIARCRAERAGGGR